MTNDLRDEDDLLAYLMEKYHLGAFPKVSTISTVKILPDIDLLDIDNYQKIVTGYEFKLLKYHKGRKCVSFDSMYNGIGQALLYFQFGVDKSYLVLGISEEIPAHLISFTKKKIEETVKLFHRSREIRETRGYISRKEGFFGFDCFGIQVWTEHEDLLMTELRADETFPIHLFEDLRHKKDCLLRGEFKWGKRFLERRKR